MTEQSGGSHCDYCGARIRSGRACRAHRDLPAIDPVRRLERSDRRPPLAPPLEQRQNGDR